jgi:hypothetical protein
MIYELFTNMHECLEVCTKAYSCVKTGLWLTKTDLTKLRISKSGYFELELVKKCRVKPMTGMCLLISSSHYMCPEMCMHQLPRVSDLIFNI